MAKKKKFNLSEIKVESFITSLKDEEKGKIKGGYPVPLTGTNPICCP